MPSKEGSDLPEILKSLREEERKAAEPTESTPIPEEQAEPPALTEGEEQLPQKEEPQVPEWLAHSYPCCPRSGCYWGFSQPGWYDGPDALGGEARRNR